LDRRNFRYRKESGKYQNYKDLNHFYKKGKERYYKYPTYYRYRKVKPVKTKPTTVPSITQKYDKLDHKRRLRELLVPLPRHIAGPVPTFSSEVQQPAEESRSSVVRFVCPTSTVTSSISNSLNTETNFQRERNWRAFPDPVSCRHYYICVVPSQKPKGIRHSCQGDRIFNQVTETCEYSQGESCLQRDRQRDISQEKSDRRVKVEEPVRSKETGGTDKQGLFVEFIQFLMRIGMFNEQVVRSMLSNKELFL